MFESLGYKTGCGHSEQSPVHWQSDQPLHGYRPHQHFGLNAKIHHPFDGQSCK